MSTLTIPLPEFKPADFASDQEVRWCPGCGDYSILAQTRKVLAKLGCAPHNTVFISGIGCSSRFPYYMNTYGFHSIHGRAPTFATGLKLARPELNVWIATGDGDGLSIGGNHLLHIIRRNPNIKILLFNNKIYGLTKGQYSPTSEKGKKTKSSPMGTLDNPLRPLTFALGAGATFAARAMATDVKHLEYVLERAARHNGTALVEIDQNCLIFNDGAFEPLSAKETKNDTTLMVEHGKPLLFGKNLDKGIRLNGLEPEVAKGDAPGILVHDEKSPSATLAFMLSNLAQPEFPEPFGVLRAIEADTLDQLTREQLDLAKAKRPADLQAVLDGGEAWTLS